MKIALPLLIIIFVTDLIVPFGIALGLLYSVCIFLTIRESRRSIILLTVLVTICTLIKFAVYFDLETEYYFIWNRVITVLTLWITAIIAVRFRILQDRQRLVAEIQRNAKETEQFIYIASHDLSEPLRTVKGMAKLLENRYGAVLGKEGMEFVHYIDNSTERMNSLIVSLLEYGRLGKKSRLETVNLQTVLDEVRQDLLIIANETGAVITASKLPQVKGYHDELRVLFQNLITNAIRFQKPGTPPKIAISAKYDHEQWRFTVSDNGIGIPEDQLEKIFTIFKRLHGREEYEGTGIGLAHCKKIVELHHGKIWATSAPGKGSTFYFTIPNQ